MAKIVRRSRRFWQGLIERFEREGAAEPHDAFAARHGVRGELFRRWFNRIGVERRAPSHASHQRPTASWPLVEIGPAVAVDGRFEIDLPGGPRVRVPASFDADALRRLLALFEEKPRR